MTEILIAFTSSTTILGVLGVAVAWIAAGVGLHVQKDAVANAVGWVLIGTGATLFILTLVAASLATTVAMIAQG